MPPEAADAPLQRLRIAALGQHPRIVIALQNQRVTGIQHGNHMRGDVTRIRQHAKPTGAVSKDKLHRFAGIVRNRERMHTYVPD
jgi:hypothetical protein